MLALVALLRPTDAKKKRSEERTEEDTEETKKLRGSKKADSKDTEDTERAVVTDVPFDCTEEVTLYESADPDPAFSYYNEALQQYVQMDVSCSKPFTFFSCFCRSPYSPLPLLCI